MNIFRFNRPDHFWIEIASVSYLALPLLLFAFGWLSLPFALLITVVLLIALYFYIRKLRVPDNTFSFSKHKTVAIFFGIALVLIIGSIFMMVKNDPSRTFFWVS